MLHAYPGAAMRPARGREIWIRVHPIGPTVFVFSGLANELVERLLPQEMVGPPLSCYRPSPVTVARVVAEADGAVRRATPGGNSPSDPVALAQALLKRGAVAMQLEFLRLSREEDEYNERSASHHRGEMTTAPPAPADMDPSAALADWLKAADVAPDFPGKDQALYLAAHWLERSDDIVQAAVAVDRLAAECPDSLLMPEALLLGGRVWEAMGDMDKARAHFRTATDKVPASVSLEARYRLAWLELSDRRFEEAVLAFLDFLDGVSKAGPSRAGLFATSGCEEAVRTIATLLVWDWVLDEPGAVVTADRKNGSLRKAGEGTAARAVRLIGPDRPEAPRLLAAVVAELHSPWDESTLAEEVLLATHFLATFPQDAGAPRIRGALVAALDRMGHDPSLSNTERSAIRQKAAAERLRIQELYPATKVPTPTVCDDASLPPTNAPTDDAKAAVGGNVDRIEEVVRSRASLLARCALAHGSRATGWGNMVFTVALSLDAKGRPVVRCAGDPGQDELGRCIQRRMASWHFPPPKRPPLTVEFKLVFAAD
jgi:tetratricopeptide (TPR) repeat protein